MSVPKTCQFHRHVSSTDNSSIDWRLAAQQSPPASPPPPGGPEAGLQAVPRPLPPGHPPQAQEVPRLRDGQAAGGRRQEMNRDGPDGDLSQVKLTMSTVRPKLRRSVLVGKKKRISCVEKITKSYEGKPTVRPVEQECYETFWNSVFCQAFTECRRREGRHCHMQLFCNNAAVL